MASCIDVSQKSIQVMLTVWVNFFVKITEQAKPMAQSAAGIIPGANPASQGRVTISMPTNPTKIEITLILVRRSPSRKGAASITHNGTENSNAKSWANGIKVRA